MSSIAALLLWPPPRCARVMARDRVDLAPADKEWLAAARGKKVLDASTVVVRIAARSHNGEPRVVECYPLRQADHVLRTGGKRLLIAFFFFFCTQMSIMTAPIHV